MSIPLTDELHAIVETCVFCPKLCRWACPVAEAEARETVTPWGLMTLLDDLHRGDAPLDAAHAEPFAHCTQCGRCQHVCKHDNDAPGAILAARALAADAGEAPPGWSAWADAPPPRSPSLDALPEGGAIQVLAGRADEARIAASLALLRAAGWRAPSRPVGDARDTGHRMLAAGRPVDFAAAADRLVVAAKRAETIICLDAEDAETLRFAFPRRGVWRGRPPRVLHLVEALDGKLPALAPAIAGDVLYLDACRLARGLGVIDAPRALLGGAVGGAIREALDAGVDGACCGAGGALPAVAPEAAAAVARDAASIEPDVPVVMVGACVDHVRRALAPRPVYGWAELLAAALPVSEPSVSEPSEREPSAGQPPQREPR